MCGFREGYALKKFNSIKLNMTSLRPLLTLLCVISEKPCQLAGPLLAYITKCAVSGRPSLGICPEKFQLNQIENG